LVAYTRRSMHRRVSQFDDAANVERRKLWCKYL